MVLYFGPLGHRCKSYTLEIGRQCGASKLKQEITFPLYWMHQTLGNDGTLGNEVQFGNIQMLRYVAWNLILKVYFPQYSALTFIPIRFWSWRSQPKNMNTLTACIQKSMRLPARKHVGFLSTCHIEFPTRHTKCICTKLYSHKNSIR